VPGPGVLLPCKLAYTGTVHACVYLKESVFCLCQGCPSWKWFFPFHYAPFASDFRGIKDVRSDFDTDTKPFCPLEQLMGVFPAASGTFLPLTWRTLMSADVRGRGGCKMVE